jgi:subfamily B ATP-binding cassette protein MsbA
MAIRPGFVNSGGNAPGMRARGSSAAGITEAKKKTDLRKALPAVWALLRPRRWLLLGGLLLMIPNRICGLAIPFATKYLVDNVINKHHPQMLVRLVLAVLLATLIQGVTSFTLTQLLSKAAQRLIAELRMQVQRHVGALPVSYYDTNRTGVLVSRIMSDVEGVRNLVGTGLVEFVGGVLTAILAFAMLIRISALMTGLAAVVMIVFTLVLRSAFKIIRPIFRERAKITGEVTGRLTESLGGVRVVKGYHAEDRESSVFAEGVKRLLDNVISTLTAQSFMSLASTVVLGLVGSMVMFFGARQVLAGKLTLGGFVSYNAFLAFLIAPIFQMVAIGTQVTEAIAGLDRTQEILGERTEDADPSRTIDIPAIDGLVEFETVEFAYEPSKPVLHGITFEAKPGSVNAFVGSSGAGKSTIISLICAFHTPDSGRITVDGYDLSHVKLNSYRQQLGVVLQESFLFDGSIRDNVSFSRPAATDEQIVNACRIARVDEFAERFPEGYDTIVGERGVKLSGGQRQRISIARAILADPRILILDEATSSLDSESEALIQEGLQYLMRGRTTFVIAHRLSTIRRADQILVVEGGQIVERGDHPTLLALGGRYRELYERQHGLEMNLFLAPGEGDSVEVPA